MQVGEEAQLHATGGELLYPDPQEGSEVAHKTWRNQGSLTTWSWGMRNISPTPRGLRAQRACGKKDQKQDSEGVAVGETDVKQGKNRVPHTCTASAAPLEELEEDISGNSPGQGAPRSLRSQQVHCGLKVPGFTSNTQVLTTQLPSSYNLPR